MANQKILHRFTKRVVFEGDFASLRLAVEAAVKQGVNLSGADLSGANLTGAYLYGANLSWANLYGANLSGANLYGANLSGANLSGANLYGANLYVTNLHKANLSGVNLSKADLSGANVTDTKFPSPTVVLLAYWGNVSDSLCADLMVYDASCHPDPTAFDNWAKGGFCPYLDCNVQRAANFKKNPKLWGNGSVCRPYDLMARLLAEKCVID